jgi:peptidoglycan/xylan/chitin deacetylase (PgdA/CDA1 family)
MTAGVPILLYHSIAADVAPKWRQWAVAPDLFAAHLQWLRANGYTGLTVSQFVAAMPNGVLPAKPVLLTFDDGLADFHTGAIPALQAHGFNATLYVATGYVGATSRWLAESGEGERPMLTWRQIGELAAFGVECGAHTRTHPQLDLLPRAEAAAEVRQSKADLEDHLGHAVASLAYPHGYYSEAVRQSVIDAGYQSACAINNAVSRLDDDHFALSRIIVRGGTSVPAFADLLEGGRLPLAPPHQPLKSKLWRWYRRALVMLGRASARPISH